MPANDFSASNYPNILQAIDDFMETGISNQRAEFKYGGNLVKNLFANQTVKGNELLEDGGLCQSVQVYFNEFGSDTVTYDGAVSDPTGTCDIGSGVKGQTEGVTYDVNSFTKALVSVDRERCDSASQYEAEVAMAFMRARVDILRRANERAYGVLNSNVQANQSVLYDTSVFPAPTTPEGNYLGIAAGQDNEDTLLKMEELIYDNAIPENYKIVSIGNNFLTNGHRGSYYSTTRDKNDIARIFRDYSLYFDRDLYPVAGNNKTLIYNPQNFFFWNTTHSSPVPTLVDPSKNKMVFYWEDPEWKWMRNGVMEPVRYEIRYDYKCTGLNSRSKEIYEDTWEFNLVGCLNWAPPGFAPLSDSTDDHPITGIIGFIRN